MEPTLNPESGFLRFRIDFSYDGTNFSGWAKQPDRRTVQGELESVVSGLTRNQVELVVAGRTDAGVHATAQVAHFDLPEQDKYGNAWSTQDLVYRLNRMITEEIRIKSITFAPPFFHARFSALRRTYIYKIADGQRQVEPLKRFDTATWYRHLDLSRLNEASRRLLGEHDFATFCKPGGAGTSIRTLERFNWERTGDANLVATVTADAFCYSMVRNIVGAVVCVGEGRFEPEWISAILANKNRISESYVFPARGLSLINVEYPSDAELKARAAITLRRRDED
ncbi:MAG: tRNA pseudouridine(38-40) synthase TruA [Candidatus Nanopelagicaceae bacterium]|nr:tRNA pseudouridine(38-40) synthase TruA [Candidatus Nanopelagicaceae bacterium]